MIIIQITQITMISRNMLYLSKKINDNQSDPQEFSERFETSRLGHAMRQCFPEPVQVSVVVWLKIWNIRWWCSALKTPYNWLVKDLPKSVQ